MSFLQGSERVTTIWGRLLLIAMIGSYILASFAHQNPAPIIGGFLLLVFVGLFYYLPLRLIFWVVTGSPEITVPFLVYLPYIILTIFGFVLMVQTSVI